MKIVYLSSSMVPSKNANSIQVMRMCDNFSKHHDVVLLCRGRGALDLEEVRELYGLKFNFRIVRFWWPNIRVLGSFVYGVQVFWWSFLNERPDVFYGRHLLSVWLARVLGCSLVYEAHMPPSSKLSRYICGSLFKNRNFSRLVCVSNKLKEYYKSNFDSISDSNCLVSPNGADKRRTEHYPGRFSFSGLVVGYVGSAKKEKGVSLVLELAALMPDQKFCIAGPEKVELESLGYRIPSNVQLTGHLSQGEVSDLLSKLDIVLAPYSPAKASGLEGLEDDAQWGSPLKIFEFMAAGRCIVASDIDIVREIVDSGVDGMLCPPGEVLVWKSMLEYLLSDEDKRVMLSRNSLNKFRGSFDRYLRSVNVIRGL